MAIMDLLKTSPTQQQQTNTDNSASLLDKAKDYIGSIDPTQSLVFGTYLFPANATCEVAFEKEYPDNPVEDGSLKQVAGVEKAITVTYTGEFGDEQANPTENFFNLPANFIEKKLQTTNKLIGLSSQQRGTLDKLTKTTASIMNKTSDVVTKGQSLMSLFSASTADNPAQRAVQIFRAMQSNNTKSPAQTPFGLIPNCAVASINCNDSVKGMYRVSLTVKYISEFKQIVQKLSQQALDALKSKMTNNASVTDAMGAVKSKVTNKSALKSIVGLFGG